MADEEILDAIRNPDSENVPILLDRLGFGGAPSPEQVYREIEEKLLLPKDRMPDHWLLSYQIRWQPKLSIPSLLSAQPTPAPTTLSFTRAGLGGRVIGYTEVPAPPADTGLQSTSLDRAPGPSKNFVRGKSGYVPFWPGGLDAAARDSGGIGALVEGGKGLRTVAPGLSRGLRLPGEVSDDDIVDFPQFGDRLNVLVESAPAGILKESAANGFTNGITDIDDLLPVSRSNLNPIGVARTARRAQIQKRDWAHVVDVNKKMTNFHQLVPEMAHKYPFELDTFQKEAVYHLEMGDSVFVAAHTSAGKTVVAEYAIALAQKHMTRAIYTSPIKALSNQKFRDFKQTFSASSVGILTGDVQINPEANCLIMTTEILRSMLYKGADLIRDVEFVIFDEVHYVNDAERGVVWEEVIIMLPEHVSIILLSATVPNTKEFADWVGRTKRKDIYVISTLQRPVPLEHYVYAGRDVHKIVDAKGAWQPNGYKDAKEALRRKQDKEREAAGLPPVQKLGARAAAPQRGTQRGGGQRGGAPAGRGRGTAAPVAGGGSRFHQADKNVYVHLLGHLKKKALLPVVVFTFSKKRCEEYAATLINSDLSSAAEKSEVHVAVERALGRLKGTDKKLPQIARMRDLLSRGIGVHHGGLLPIVKEVVELLFARGLVKVLFATETFAMGVNMPAKCVVFSNIRKHDGRNFRDILPGEYTQMAGRAGRRGLDATGTVIINANDDMPEQDTLTTMLLGKPTKLQSQFRLTYNMILNLLRVEALKVEEMIKRSFSENASQRLLPDQQQRVVEGEKRLAILPKLKCDVCSPDIGLLYDINAEIMEHNLQLLNMVITHRESKNVLTPGRVVVLRDEHFNNNLAVLLGTADAASSEGVRDKIKSYIVLALVDEERKLGKKDIDPLAVSPRWSPRVEDLVVEAPVYNVKHVSLTSITLVTSRMIKIDARAIVDRHLIAPMNEVAGILADIVSEWIPTANIPEVEWSKMRSLEFQETLRSRNHLVQRLSTVACTMCADFEDHYAILHSEKVLRANIANLKFAVSDQNLELIPDYEQRIEVLQDLKFIDENSTVLLKGRVACEINSANELVLTELILENTLAAYTPEEVVSLLSCFVFQEKTDVEPKLTDKLEEGRTNLIAISDRVEAVQTARKLAASEFRMMKFGLMEVVYEWAKGMPFEEIATLTDVAEGTIVRVITRLDETCREVRDAARVIGDADLMKKMEEAQGKIRRDIVFAASLYF